MHGLGHVFRLNDVEGDGFESGSIMVNHNKLSSNKNLWSGFSPLDKSDLREKYPLSVTPPEPPAWDPKIEFSCSPVSTEKSANWLTVDKTYRITATYTNPALTNPTYQFSIENMDPGVACQYTSASSNSCDLKFTAHGTSKLIVKILENGVERDRYEEIYHGVINQFTHDVNSFQLRQPYEFSWRYWAPEAGNLSVDYTVQEFVFDDGTDKSVTIEKVDDLSARMYFNECGRYVVTATLKSGTTEIRRETVTFKGFYTPSVSVSLSEGVMEVIDSLSPPYNTKITHDCNVSLSGFGLLPERVMVEVYLTYTQQTLPFKRVDMQIREKKIGTIVRQRGESLTFQVPFEAGYSRNASGYVVRKYDVKNPRVVIPYNNY